MCKIHFYQKQYFENDSLLLVKSSFNYYIIYFNNEVREKLKNKTMRNIFLFQIIQYTSIHSFFFTSKTRILQPSTSARIFSHSTVILVAEVVVIVTFGDVNGS